MNNPNPLAEFIESVRTVFEDRDDGVNEKLYEGKNVGRIQSLYQAAADGNLDDFKSHLAENVSFRIVGAAEVRFDRAANGVEAATELVRNNFSRLEYQVPELISIVAQGDLVYIRGKEAGRFKGTESDYQLNWVQEYTFKDGKVVSFVQFLDDAAPLPSLP